MEDSQSACIHNRWLQQISSLTVATKMTFSSKPAGISSSMEDIQSGHPHVLSFERIFAHKCVLDPLGYRRLAWDVLSVMALCGDAIWIPMSAFDPPDTLASQVYAWTITMYWACDMLVSLSTGYFGKRGERVMSRRLIAVRYFKTWMIPDVVAVATDFGITIMNSSHAGQAIGFARAGKLARIIRAARALRLLRLVKLRRIVFLVEDMVDSEYVSIILTMMKNMFGLLAVNHAIACAWFALGNSGYLGWVSVYGFGNATLYAKYMVSLHWSLAQFTPAPMNIQPQTSVERAFALVILVFGLLVFSSFVASNTTALSRIRSLTRNDMKQHFLLRKYLAENNISLELSMRVLRYTELVRSMRSRKAHASKVEYLSLLSRPLFVRLQSELLYPHLSCLSFFFQYNTCDPEAMNQICAAATKHQSFSKDDVLFSVDSKAEHMMFLTEGLLLYKGHLKSSSVTQLQLVPGWWMCEGVLWVQSWVHQGSVCAVAETDIIALDEAKFYEITCRHPNVYELACDYAKTFVQGLDQARNEQGYFSDLPQEKVDEFFQSQEVTFHDIISMRVLKIH